VVLLLSNARYDSYPVCVDDAEEAVDPLDKYPDAQNTLEASLTTWKWLDVQVFPSKDSAVVFPPEPYTIHILPVHTTALTLVENMVDILAIVFQWIPSGDVAIAPPDAFLPTATNNLPFHAISYPSIM
jgi:hypothetical protein